MRAFSRSISRNRLEIALVLLAIALRVLVILLLQSHLVPRSTYEHGEIAANLLSGRGFSIRFLGVEGLTSQQAPVYPFLLAALYAVAGVGQPPALLLVQLGQAVLGGLLVLGVIRLARAILPARPDAGLMAGFLVAIHPTLVYAATHVQVALLGAALLTWTLVLGYGTGRTGRLRDAVLTGLCLALLALTDPILSLGFLGVTGGIWLGGRGWKDSCRLAGLTAIVAVLGMMPWLIRNALVHGEFVAIKSTFGYAFWQGNCNLSAGTDKVVRSSVDRVLAAGSEGVDLAALNRRLWAARHEAGYLDDIALTKADYAMLGRFTEPERSRILFRRALAELRESPGRYLELCLRRFRYFWLFDETNPKSRVLAYRIAHLGLLVSALLGLALARPSVRLWLAPTLITAGAVSMFHTLTIVSARFHIPIEPLMAIWAASGLSRWERSSRRSTAPGHHVKRVRVVSGLVREGRLVDRVGSTGS